MSDALVLPTFLVIGAMKAGTTTLHDALRTHPSIFMPEQKEPEFFSEDRNWRRGVEWYSTLFTAGVGHPARGEASTGYTRHPRHPDAAARIASVIPDGRLVYVLRDPIERMRSHYRHSVLMGREHRSVDEALSAGGSYLDTSRYGTQLGRYAEHFPTEQLLTVFSEDLRARPRETVADVCRFVGADPDLLPSDLPADRHVSDQRLRMPPTLRRLRTSPTAQAIGRRAPGVSRRVAGLVSGRGAGVDDDPSPETRRLLLDELHDDLVRLRELVGPLPGSWGAVD